MTEVRVMNEDEVGPSLAKGVESSEVCHVGNSYSRWPGAGHAALVALLGQGTMEEPRGAPSPKHPGALPTSGGEEG